MPRFAERLRPFATVQIGVHHTPFAYRTFLKGKGCKVDDVAYELLSRANLSREPQSFELVKYPLNQILSNNCIHEEALKKLSRYSGLSVCPYEVAFALRGEYLRQPEREALVVLTEEILSTPGSVRKQHPHKEVPEGEEGGLGDWAVRRGVWGVPALVVRDGVPIVTTSTFRNGYTFSPPRPMWILPPGNKNLKAVLIKYY